jgi:CRISPR-associated endonuclease/helicase Cas3
MTVNKLTEGQLILLWGKTCRKEHDPKNFASRYHPLLFHLLDVAHTALELLDDVLSSAFKKRIASALGCEVEEARFVIAFLAGVHDVGKAIPGFQFRSDTPLEWLRELLLQSGFTIPLRCENRPHSYITTKRIREFLFDHDFFWKNKEDTNIVLAHITGAHHGTFPNSSNYPRTEMELGDEIWRDAQLALLECLRNALCPNFTFPEITWKEEEIGAVAQLAGLISVADWVGSSRLFTPEGSRDNTRNLSVAKYAPLSRKRAQDSLQEFGWARTPLPQNPRPDFAEFWGFPPNSLQRSVMMLTENLTNPFFLLIEAPMGVGKTEAALWANDAAQSSSVNEGFYIALPTQATSNAMHSRVKGFLQKRYDNVRAIHLQLVHSHAKLSDDVEIIHRGLEPIYDESCTPEEASIVAASWFCGAKRPLLAPFGVGTIDQSLLATLETRHWFVRQFGLAGKVIIFDEVHAYDTYMSNLLFTLIGWLREIGCSVIMLSATLPTFKRCELLRAWGGELPSREASYPRLTWLYRDQEMATSQAIDSRDLDKKTVKIVHLRIENLGKTLCNKLQNGGCVAIICNTIDQAQQLYVGLRNEIGHLVPDWTLFHARTPFGWRQEVEKSVLRRFGKHKANRPHCAVVIATQIIEQSLDLDFDWIASFMAPGDLLLQRMGRLHRHSKDENNNPIKRPDLLREPQFAIICNALGDEVPTFDGTQGVYDLLVLLRSWLVWRKISEVQLPDCIETIVKDIYDVEQQVPNIEWQNKIEEARHKATEDELQAIKTAGNVTVSTRNDNGRLHDSSLFVDFPCKDLKEDDDPEIHKALRAKTRQGDPSVTVVCLYKENDRVFLLDQHGFPDKSQEIDLKSKPTMELTSKLINLSLPISKPPLFRHFINEEVPPGWKKSPLLRHSRPLFLSEGSERVKGFRINLDRELGLIISKVKSE